MKRWFDRRRRKTEEVTVPVPRFLNAQPDGPLLPGGSVMTQPGPLASSPAGTVSDHMGDYLNDVLDTPIQDRPSAAEILTAADEIRARAESRPIHERFTRVSLPPPEPLVSLPTLLEDLPDEERCEHTAGTMLGPLRCRLARGHDEHEESRAHSFFTGVSGGLLPEARSDVESLAAIVGDLWDNGPLDTPERYATHLTNRYGPDVAAVWARLHDGPDGEWVLRA